MRLRLELISWTNSTIVYTSTNFSVSYLLLKGHFNRKLATWIVLGRSSKRVPVTVFTTSIVLSARALFQLHERVLRSVDYARFSG